MKQLTTIIISFTLMCSLALPVQAATNAGMQAQLTVIANTLQALSAQFSGQVLGVSTDAAVTFDGITAGETVADTIYVTAVPSGITNITNVVFTIDGVNVNTEGVAPYTLGGDNNGNLNGYNTTGLSAGTHTLTAIVTADGETFSESIEFVAEAFEPDLAPEPTPDPEPEPDLTTDPDPEPIVTPTSDGLYYSGQDLGWVENQDITDEFADFINTVAQSGDTIVLEHMYQYSALASRVVFPTDFMLAAVEGAGMNIVDTTTRADDSYSTNLGHLFELSDRNVLNNVVFNMPEAPNTGSSATNPVRHIDFSNLRFIDIDGNDVTLFQTEFNGQIGHHVSVNGSDNVTFHRTIINGGFWAVTLGHSNDFRAHNSIFKNSKGDGIKTVGNSCPAGVLRPVFTENLFENNSRDAIDTTGGFAEAVVRDNVFRNSVFTSLDLKNHFEKGRGFCDNHLNRDILIEDNLFLGSGNNAIVLTTLDRSEPPVINDSNAAEYIVKNVVVRNNIFQNSGGRMWLIKDAHSVFWDNNELLGGLTEIRTLRPDETALNVSEGNTNYNLVGTNTTFGPARTFSEMTGVPFPAGQGTLTFNIPDPDDVDTPAPTPDPEPTPEPEINTSTDDSSTNSDTTSDNDSDNTTTEDETDTTDDTNEDTANNTGGGGSSDNDTPQSSNDSFSISPVTTTASSNSVVTTDNLNVRVTPGGTVVEIVSQGTNGTKTADTPIQQGGYTWIKVNFTGGISGWVAEEYLDEVVQELQDPSRRELLMQIIALLQLILELKQRLI